MRLSGKLSIFFKALGVELCIFGFIGLVFLFQYNKAQGDLVEKTKAISETIAEQASSFFSSRKGDTTSDEFFLFLDERLGRKKLFNTYEIAPKFFSVVLRKDVERSGLFGELREAFYPPNGVKVAKGGGVLSVSVPFRLLGDTEPFGIIKIDSDLLLLKKNVFASNFFFYAAILIVLNNQVFILYLLLRRKNEVTFERGYLKEHSIGALKIFHRVLGDIIEDHETDFKNKPKKQDAGEKVVSILDMFERRNK
jgi:hypothetical protein